ncbi:glycosyltransferase [Undibacterium sp. Ren11W]|uniref:glycosyltransferase n=1 Tax=Undibacterium sp. Ren11W TaxID=3413045 RepID=UPI003BF45CD3
MIVAFRISSLGFGGAERVFISVADYLFRTHKVEIHFVVDRVGTGETEEVVRNHGFKLLGLECSRTARSIGPLKNYIDAFRPDVLISAYTDTNMGALISSKLAKHKCLTIVSEHASLDEHWQHASWKRRLLLNNYVALGYRIADHVLTVSKGIAGQITQRMHQPEKVSCIYNPVRFSVKGDSLGLANDETLREKKIILAVGRIAKQKDYSNLLRAFKLVLTRHDALLVIVGGVHEIAEKELLDTYIASAGLASKIEFVGYTDKVETYYRNADVFVLSSAWEGFGNVLVEALAFGLPIVSTDCNYGPAEILSSEKYGMLVPVGDSIAMADAICRTFDSPVRDKDLLRLRSMEFSEDRIGAQYWDLITNLLVTR